MHAPKSKLSGYNKPATKAPHKINPMITGKITGH